MPDGHKILLLDDERELLSSYCALLRDIPSHPEVRSCNSGPHALALLDSEPFTMLICDLKMPKMDGLQVIAVARRKFPRLRIVVLTAVVDEKYRARAYAMGAELFWRKPASREEILLFQDSIESLLSQQAQPGFRGMQNKSLMDIIQLESLSQCSSVLRIVQGTREGNIWLQNGEVIDAQTSKLSGEEAFREIFSWHSGNFEILPPQANRPRTIHNSCQGLLLDSAQALDEAQQRPSDSAGEAPAKASPLAALARFEGVEFVLTINAGKKIESWGLENAEEMTRWARDTQKQCGELGAILEAGDLVQVQGGGWQRSVALISRDQSLLCVGFHRALSADQVHKTMNEMAEKWVS